MPSEEKKGYEYKLEFGEDEPEFDKLLELGIKPSLGWLIEKSKCERCGLPYEECGCSKILDKGVAQRIEKAFPFPFWTDCPL
jgi:hypothetical protein